MSTAVPPISDQQKAAEVNKAMLPKVKKYGPILVPLAIATITTTLIVNIPQFRYWLEEKLPAYVGFVRKHYGFEHEDLEEIKRIKAVLQRNKHDVNVTVKFRNREEKRINVNGSKLVQELINECEAVNTSKVVSLVFEDDANDTEWLSELQLSDANGRIPSPTMTSTNKRPPFASPLLWRTSLWDTSVHRSIGSRPIERVFSGLFQPPSPPSSSLGKASTLAELALPELTNSTNENDFTEARHRILRRVLVDFQAIGYTQFENILDYKLFYLREHVNSLGLQQVQLPSPYVLSKQQRQVHTTVAPKAASDAIKDQVLKEIAKLTEKIALVEHAKQIGSIGVDDAQRQVQELKNEITQLRRKHLNTFYFF